MASAIAIIAALALTAGHLVRIAAEPPGRIRNADLRQQLNNTLVGRIAAQTGMQIENLPESAARSSATD